MHEDAREAPRVGSLFSGIGGLDHGLARAGFEHSFLCEKDGWRRDVLRARFPGVPIYDDVRDVGAEPAWPRGGREAGTGHAGEPQSRERRIEPQLRGETLTDGGERVERHRGSRADAGRDVWTAGLDLIAGGTPCQDLSVAGQRRGLAGDRSGLFYEYVRVVDALRPRWLLWENVPGAFSSNGGRDFGAVLGSLADIGYGLGWRLLDSRYFGVPQRRRRVFVVGTLADGDPRAAAERAGAVLAVGSRCARHPATRGEAREEPAVASLSGLGNGGPDDNDGQGGRLVAVSTSYGGWREGDDPMLSARDYKSPTTLIADTLTSGSHPGSNMPGRRREDDTNLVTAFDWQAGAPSSDNEQSGGKGRKWIVRAGDYTGAIGKDRRDAVSIGAASVRRLTPTECERLQALPDGWTDLGPDSRRYAGLGDAVTASVAEWIGRRILATP